MKKLIFILLFISTTLQAQIVLTVEGQTITNSNTGWWDGYNVVREEWTTFSFLNNSITSVNASGYQLQAGDEVPGPDNNNLDGAIITGNRFTWNGTDPASITHGDFMGYNINYAVRYNYLDKTPYGILFKSGTDAGVNMTYTSGGAAYNIVKNAKKSVVSKGMNGVPVYNNTFYTNKSGVVMIDTYGNTDRIIVTDPTGIKIKNNILYAVYADVIFISVETGSLATLECDYNVYYCENSVSNYPTFKVGGVTKTWAQWRAYGFDTHSVVVNPNFIDLTNFVPSSRLDYGTNLGVTWQDGLATDATWVVNQTPGKTTQNGTWQAGARVYSGGGTGNEYYVSNSGNDGNAGTSMSAPWKTVAKVNSPGFSYPAGSIIRFQRGGVWYERLIPPTSGISGSPIVFDAYDSGNDPVITARGALPGWSSSGNWTEQGSYRWSIYYGGNYRHRIWLNGTEAQEAQYTSTLSSTLRFYSGTNVIWVYSTTSPWLAFSSMEISGVQNQALYVVSKNYITFRNIDFRGGGGGGWDCVTVYSSNYIIFEYCKIGKDAGCYGLKVTDSDNNIVRYNTFDTGDRNADLWQAENSEDGIAIMDGSDNNLIHNNYFQDWGHTTMALTKNQTASSVTNNEFYNNTVTYTTCDFGRGFGAGGPMSGSYTGNKFYNNHIYNTPSASMANFPSLQVFNNLIDNVTGPVAYGREMYTYGLGVQEYLVGSTQYRAVGMKIYNNTIVNCYGPGLEYIGWEAVDIEQNEIINNLFAGNGHGTGENNIQFEGDNYPEINSNIYRNNLFYSSATSNVIRYHNSTMTVAAFNALTGSYGDVMANNISGNPLFISSVNFHLQAGSPVIDAGYSPTLSAYDKDGIAWGSPPTIGAYEYTGAITTPTVTTTAVSNIGYTTAISGGNVTSDGGATVTARGVCWSTSSNPTTSNPKTSNGTGTGVFVSDITLLQMGTLYYVRAYATNSQGTSYGANQQFTTLQQEDPPPSGEGKIIVVGGQIVKSSDKIVKQ